jgi:hypothetical protein
MLVNILPLVLRRHIFLLNRFDCVSFATSCKKALAIFAFKLLHNILDCSEVLSQLAFNAGSRGTKSRHYRLFYLPAHRTDVGKFSPLCNMCRLANDQGVYSSISISSCRIRHISNGWCRTLQMFSILEYHANSSLFNEFVCKLDFF